MIKRSCLCAALMLALAGAAPPVLAQAEARHVVELQAQDLGSALKLLAQQTRMQIVYSADLVQGKQAPALEGALTATEALERLLMGSGLKYEFLDAQTVTLSPVAPPPSPRVEAVRMISSDSAVGAVAQAAEAGVNAASAVNAPHTAQDRGPAQDIDTVVVTGTRIRGGTTPSPVITIGVENIREEGFADLGEVARSVPQNYAGGQNPGVLPFTISGAGGQNTNITGGSSLNLRGLGQDASLTLLNGRRMAYGGVSQGVDISAIPVEAVERIEIVPDGASAIYGSDAVGGVANVLLRRDHDGVSLGVRYGRATDGGLATREYSATAGTTWATGGLIATAKDVSTDPIYARQRDYTAHLRDPWTLYPQSDQRSALVSAHQQLGNIAELRLDAFRTERSQSYSVFNDVGNQLVMATPETATSLVSPSIELFLPNDWTVSTAAAWAKNSHDQFQSTTRLTTGAVTVTDLCVCTEGRVVELGAEGPIYALPGGVARLAVGAGYRRNDFLEYNRIAGVAAIEGDEASRFAYAELNLPLVGGARDSDADAARLALSLAVRSEDYDSFGRVSTPKLGIVYRLSTDLSLKTSWGKSFKAPTLYQLLRSEQVVLRPAVGSGGRGYPATATVLYLDGGNPELDPERARTWTASVAFHPAALPGLETELTYFDIDYRDRVVQPIADPTQAMSNPAYAEFVQLAPTREQLAAIIARDGDGIVTNQIGRPYDPGDVVGIIYFHFRNAVAQRIRGLDLSSAYRFDLGSGRMTLRGSASWLDSSQRFSTTQFDLSGTLHNPPTLTGRFGAVWTSGAVTASTFLNHKGGVKNVVANERTASFTTVDTTLRYAWARDAGAATGWDLALSMQNLFDRAPPLHDISTVTPFLVPPYDATNYSPIGRFVSVSVTRHW